MSKASEWAEQYKSACVARPPECIGERWRAGVDNDGDCAISVPRNILKADDCVVLGRWLLDTFGDKP